MKRVAWGRVREIVRKEFRQLIRDPRTRGMMFGAPVLQLLLFGYAVNTDVRDTAVYVVDHDASADSRSLVDAFTSTGYFEIVGRSDRSGDLVRALDHGDAILGIDIPPDFSRDLRSGRGATIQLLFDGTLSNSATVAQGYAQRIVQRFALQRAAAAGHPLTAGGVDLRVRAWYNPTLESRIYNVPAVLGIIITMGHMDGGPEVVGHHVAAALVGTFLGILLAYGFVGPLSMFLEHRAREESQYFIAMKTCLLASLQGYAPQVAVEFGRKAIFPEERPKFQELEERVKSQ